MLSQPMSPGIEYSWLTFSVPICPIGLRTYLQTDPSKREKWKCGTSVFNSDVVTSRVDDSMTVR